MNFAKTFFLIIIFQSIYSHQEESLKIRLKTALKARNIDKVHDLIQQNIDINTVFDEKRTPLMMALKYCPELIPDLIKLGADPSIYSRLHGNIFKYYNYVLYKKQNSDLSSIFKLIENSDWKTLSDNIDSIGFYITSSEDLRKLKSVLLDKVLPDLESFLFTFYQGFVLKRLQYGTLDRVKNILSLDLPKHYYGYFYKGEYTLVDATITPMKLSMIEQLKYIVKYRRESKDGEIAYLIEEYIKKKWEIDISDKYYPQSLNIKYKED